MMLRFVRRVVVIGWLGLAALGFSGHALAEGDTATGDAAEDRAQSFRSVNGGVKEDIPGGPLMLAAYAVVWLAIFGYVVRLVRLHRGVVVSLNRLERALTESPSQHGVAGSTRHEGADGPAQADLRTR
jgi:CcmD family protein